MRGITIKRKWKLLGWITKSPLVIDGKMVGRLRNGETATFSINEDVHKVYVYYDQMESDVLAVKPGKESAVFTLEMRLEGFVLRPDDSALVDIIKAKVKPEPKSQVGSYICGILLMLLLLAGPVGMYASSELGLLGFIISAAFAITCGITFIIAGFWFVPIPLPIVSVGFSGSLKPHIIPKYKNIFGLLSFASGILTVVTFMLLRIE